MAKIIMEESIGEDRCVNVSSCPDLEQIMFIEINNGRIKGSKDYKVLSEFNLTKKYVAGLIECLVKVEAHMNEYTDSQDNEKRNCDR